MATRICRSCGATIEPDVGTCPSCGIADPVTTPPPPSAGEAGAPVVGSAARDPEVREREPVAQPESTGTRVGGAIKALGCFVLALIALGIAAAIGLLDIFF